jgi:hypothetical protein
MSKIGDLFKKEFQKVFTDPSVKVNPSTINSMLKYNSALKEDEVLKGGKADKMSLGDIAVKHKVDIETLTDQFLQGVMIEKEHTKDKKMAVEIAMDRLAEDPNYYKKIKKIESKEDDDKMTAKKQFSKDLQILGI